MDVIAKQPDCDGQAADALSAYSQEGMLPDVWIRLPRHKWPKSWMNIQNPVVPLARNLYGHPLAGHLWETQFE